MRLLQFAAVVIPAVVLSSCGDGTPPAAPSSAAAPSPAAAQATPASAEALAPLFGTWALDPAKCDGPVLKISQARFEGAENGCDISGFTDNGDGSYTAAMSCTADGQTAGESIKMRPIFAPTGEGIDLTYIDRDNLTTTVLRCPAPGPAN
jgi:hypothetical protein